MSMLSIIAYALISSLIVSSASLLLVRLVARRKQPEAPVDWTDAQIVRLISQSIASGLSPNMTISEKVRPLLDPSQNPGLESHQREVLEWLYGIVEWPDTARTGDEEPSHDRPRFEPVVEYVPIGVRAIAEDPGSFSDEYGSEDAVDDAVQIGDLVTELRSDGDPDRRANAAIKLGKLRDASGVPHLVQALRNDGAGQVRTFSAVALGMIGSTEAVTPLIDVIKTQITKRIDIPHDISYGGFQLIRTLQREIDPEPEEWLGQDPIAAQIWALGRIGNAEACDALVERLSDDDPGIRWFAAWALGKIGNHRVVPALAAMTDDPNDDVRWIAIWALGRMNSSGAVQRLITCSGDDNPSIRRIAIWALGRSGDARGRDVALSALTDSERGVRQVASWALSRIEPEVARSA